MELLRLQRKVQPGLFAGAGFSEQFGYSLSALCILKIQVEVKHRTMKIRAAILKILALALATFLLSAQGFTQDSATLYKSKCAACHGADGKGATPVGAKIGVRDLAS